MTGSSSWTLLGVALSTALFFAACSERPAPARFPHRVHLADIECDAPGKPACLSCNSCHAPSERDRAQKLPSASICDSCHKNDAREVRAVLAVKPERPVGEITINHDLHLALSEIQGQCVPCHAGVVESGRSTLPSMSQCFTCHEHEQQWQRGQCSPCHERRDLERTLPTTFLRHDAAFVRRHGDEVATQKELCQSCHTERQCQSCHDVTQALGVERRHPEAITARGQVHRGDFMTRHAIEAKSQPARCSSCHAPQDCDSCHVARGVSGNAIDARNPHPPEWIGSNVNSSNFHGHDARRDIAACAACHEQGPATNCIRCHKVGAYGGNPHPRGWSSARGTGETMCRYCHE